MADVRHFNEARKNFEANARALVGTLRDGAAALEQPEIIYHYTDDNGLHGILNSRKLWASNVSKLNDPSELRFGLELLVTILDKAVIGDTAGVRSFVDLIRDFAGPAGFAARGTIFICSFSSNGDDLGQWRAYADNGRGFALGFASEPLSAQFLLSDGTDQADSPERHAFRVSYEEDRIDLAHRELAKWVLPVVRMIDEIHAPPGRHDEYRRLLAVYLSYFAAQISLYFKHHAYRNECEFRFLDIEPTQSTPKGQKVRRRPYSLIEYLELDWKACEPMPLKRVVVGPANWPTGVQYARDCLTAAGLPDVEVTHSPIPYRVS